MNSEDIFSESSFEKTGLDAFEMPYLLVLPAFSKRSLFSNLFCKIASSDWLFKGCKTFFFLILFVSSRILCNFATLFGGETS